MAARTRDSRGFASRGLPWSPVLIWLFLYCWLRGSRGSRGSRRLPWSPVVSRPVVSRIVFAVSLLWAPGLPWSPVAPVVSRGLPPRGLPYCFCCFFIVGSWSPVAPVAPVVAPVVSRGLPFRLPFRLPWSPASFLFVLTVSLLLAPGLPWLPWLPSWLPWSPVVSRGLPLPPVLAQIVNPIFLALGRGARRRRQWRLRLDDMNVVTRRHGVLLMPLNMLRLDWGGRANGGRGAKRQKAKMQGRPTS